MLLEFSAGLAVSLLLAVLLFWYLTRRLRLNRNKANSFAPFYLLPVLITILLAAVTIALVFPRVLDLPHIITGNYDVVETTVQSDMLTDAGIEVDAHRYFVPHRYLPKPGTRVRLYITPNTGYIMRIDTIAEESTDGLAYFSLSKNQD